MEVGEKAVGAMQAYLRLKRYILPSGIARKALQAALPFIALPSAARELALEDILSDQNIKKICVEYVSHKGENPYQVKHGGYERWEIEIRAMKHAIGFTLRALCSPDHADADTLETYYARQIEWSKNTFGPALRTKGIIDHIKKELKEIEAEPHDLSEWIDVVILAMDGFWRHGGTVDDLMPRLLAKQQKNMARTWPDWRTMSEDQAIEHDRSFDADHAYAGKVEGDGWRPIESAPNGEPFLAFEHHEMGAFMFVARIGTDGQVREDAIGCPMKPTHWRPLPSAPASEGAE